MFRDHPPAVRRGTPSCCLVSATGAGLSPVGTEHTVAAATSLVRQGWRVHCLLCGPIERALQDALAAAGAQCTWLDEVRCLRALTLDGPHLFAALHDSDRVRFALEVLLEQHPFDVIDFPERGGLGFRTVQAKRTGQAFADVRLSVTLHGPGAALRHAHGQWLSRPEDLALDHAERYAFEHADVQQAAEARWLDEARRLGWRAPSRKPDVSCRQQGDLHVGLTPRRSPSLVTVSVAYYNLPEYLGATLASLEQQTYPHLEVLVINDGSTTTAANEAFESLRTKHPRFRFITQENRGIGGTRNRGLEEAQGEFFLPVDADNIAHPDMVRRFVLGMQQAPEIAALTCYFLAFSAADDLAAGRFAYAYKPTGGPRVLGCLQNVYGDGNAIFRTETLKAIGGFDTDRDTSFEDWETFVRLVNAGHDVDVLPDFLFYYRHRAAGFSRTTNLYRNHQRVLRRYIEIDRLPEEERAALWNVLVGCHHRLAELEDANRALTARLESRRYRMVDGVRSALQKAYRGTIGRIATSR